MWSKLQVCWSKRGVAYPVEFPLLDEVQESLELFPESGVGLVHPQQTGPALGNGGRVVHGETVAVQFDGEGHGLGSRVAVGRGTGAWAVPLISVLVTASPQTYLHLTRPQHTPVEQPERDIFEFLNSLHTKIESLAAKFFVVNSKFSSAVTINLNFHPKNGCGVYITW